MESVLWETQICTYYIQTAQEALSPKPAKVRWQHRGRMRGLPEALEPGEWGDIPPPGLGRTMLALHSTELQRVLILENFNCR